MKDRQGMSATRLPISDSYMSFSLVLKTEEVQSLV